MLGGESSSVGIVFYDSAKKGDNAVFCHFEGDIPIIESGEKSALLEKMKKIDEKFEKSDHFIAYMVTETLVFAAIIAAVWIFCGGFFPVFGTFLFSVIAWFPCLVLIYGCSRTYLENSDFEAFRSFHGAEHMMVAYASDEPETFDFEKAKTYSPFHRECGTVYAASALILSAVIGISFSFIPEMGLLKFIGIIFGTAVLLFLNLLNPCNPLMLFQRKVVKTPDENTLRLAFEGIKKLFSEEN